jgi:hypothetical protein
MIFDHVGVVLFPRAMFFRIVGRISFPLFAFLIAYGSTKTRSQFKYALRLLLFAIVLQPFAGWALADNVFDFRYLNVFFTLFFGALTVFLVQKTPYLWVKIAISAGVFALVCVPNIWCLNDYAAAGVALIVLFYAALTHSLNLLRVTALPALVIFNIIMALIYGNFLIQWVSVFAVVPLLLFKPVRLKISAYEKWAFYAAFPVHLVVIYLISLI